MLKQFGSLQRVVAHGRKPIPRKSLVVRFFEKVQIDPRGCWIWQATTASGYGWFRHPDTHKAHRAAYLMLVGPLTSDQVIDHLCGQTLCVNPDHLDPTTPMVNVHRGKRGTPWKVCDANHPHVETRLTRRSNGQMRCVECHNAGARRRSAARKPAADAKPAVAGGVCPMTGASAERMAGAALGLRCPNTGTDQCDSGVGCTAC